MAAIALWLTVLSGFAACTTTNAADVSISSNGLSASRTIYLNKYQNCSGTFQFTSPSDNVLVRSWEGYHTTFNTYCLLTFDAYPSHGIKFRFSRGDYLNDCDDVTLAIYTLHTDLVSQTQYYGLDQFVFKKLHRLKIKLLSV